MCSLWHCRVALSVPQNLAREERGRRERPRWPTAMLGSLRRDPPLDGSSSPTLSGTLASLPPPERER